ncbi:class I glutamine amidotransferase-like protein [Hygrophoropsis aurantiaca]|uniref:Class I glutamine amidotransferase-like protein n=1 Tax=Hygrophoropsis aurantiaca TaxID=72124 RepID=A0ACB7ZT95_9AGAM|nr:class I glutamine amidotransferase-like protein [Hygrophoropsis aurantiaca]
MPSDDIPPRAKIALLICDPTHEKFIEDHGNINALFTGLYTNLVTLLNGEEPAAGMKRTRLDLFLPEVITMKAFDVDEFDVIGGELPDDVAEYDSVIVSGSAHGVNDKDEWILELTKFLHDTAENHPQVKLIGICFGHQIISRAVFDLTVKANPEGWEIGPYEIDLINVGTALFPGRESLTIEMFHHDAVGNTSNGNTDEASSDTPAVACMAAGEHVEIWGKTEKTENQGLVSLYTHKPGDELTVDDIHIFTCQGHPELTQKMTDTLLDLFEEDIDEKAVEEARERINAFKDSNRALDWHQIALLMWALSTGHPYEFSMTPWWNNSNLSFLSD